ncbi:MAG: ABC transporter ATP-binding protein [Fibrobacteres bacterium]|nr:ABC transporter ATP-binding protein [Fibrobacterota bacterium]
MLDICDVTKNYYQGIGKGKCTSVLKNISLSIPEKPAKIIAVAGESGSGKTTLANVVLGFTKQTTGSVKFRGREVSSLNRQELAEYRRKVQAVFQDPYESYNPFYKVRHIFDMAIKNFNLTKDKYEAEQLIENSLNVVGIRGGEVLEKYPHQLSGGQRQRMMIARAYMLKPDLIVADEPVSMVDASLRAIILDAMQRLRDEHNISFLYITHDLSTAYQICDDMVVLYHGEIVEKGSAVDIIERPNHPYVKQLIASIPVPDPDIQWDSTLTISE